MNAEEYKSLINQKDVFNYTTLNVTIKELVFRQEFGIAAKLKRLLENNQIDKPDLHLKRYDTSTTYYKVDLCSDDIDKIIDIFLELEVIHIGENGETTPTASFYASIFDKWNRLV
jgi:hypothetical protein